MKLLVTSLVVAFTMGISFAGEEAAPANTEACKCEAGCNCENPCKCEKKEDAGGCKKEDAQKAGGCTKEKE